MININKEQKKNRQEKSFVIDSRLFLEEKQYLAESIDIKDMMVLEAYGGAGVLTDIYTKKAKGVYAIERKKEKYEFLYDRLGKRKNLLLFRGDDKKHMKFFINNKMKFNLIDLDSDSDCYEQIRLSAKLIDNGILVLTTTEMYGLITKKRKMVDVLGEEVPAVSTILSKYNVSLKTRFFQYPLGILRPFVCHIFEKEKKQAVMFHYFITNRFVRMYFRIGKYQSTKEDLKKLKGRKKAIGWASKFVFNKTKKVYNG